MTEMVLGGVLLVCLGLLLGATWTIQAVQAKLRQQAKERRKLDEEWSAVHTARQRLVKCPRCGLYLAPKVAQDPTAHDD